MDMDIKAFHKTKHFLIILKGLVWMIILAFLIVIGRAAMSGGIEWGSMFKGFLPLHIPTDRRGVSIVMAAFSASQEDLIGFAKIVAPGNKIDIDASAVTTVDTATLQLLLVLKQTAVKMQKQVTIDFPSERFIEAAELLNLAELLNVDQAAAGFF